jgi:signal transduction histidine kinase
MTAPRLPRPPAFFWQGVLVLLPVAALAVASLVSLRQDERAVENEARSRAAESVSRLGQALRAQVSDELHRFLTLQNVWMIELRSAGQPSVSGVFPNAKLQADIDAWERDYPGAHFADLAMAPGAILDDARQIEPPDFPAVPQPPKWFRELSSAQRILWEELRAGGSQKDLEAWRQAFWDSHPTEEARQAVWNLFQPPEQMSAHSNSLPTETGITFEEIACYRLLTMTNAQLTDALLQSIWWQAIDHPSIVSPKLLELAGGLSRAAHPLLQQRLLWTRKLFASQTKAADCLASLRQLPDLRPWKKAPWAHWTQDGSALAVVEPMTFVNPGNDFNGNSLAGRGYAVSLAPRPVLEAITHRALAENKFLIPNYASTAVMIEGVSLAGRWEAATRDQPSLLGRTEQAAGKYNAQDAIHLEVSYYLTSREQMLASARRRAKLFGALVFAAALTALAGLWSARRAFQRQLQLNKDKSNFVSSVSHELRAPIASVRLMAENLERGKISGPEKQGEYFRFIVQECRRLSSLIENVLDISRIEQGRKQYEFEPTNLVALTETTVKLMEPYATEIGVRLEFHPALAMPLCERTVDGRALQQALVNLIDNAVKHSPKGQTVTVGIDELKNPKAEIRNPNPGICLYVADHGPGIPVAEREKIFERFYRLGSELRRETQGVGIGLSVVKHVVEAHHGRVRVESETGGGSRFIIEL